MTESIDQKAWKCLTQQEQQSLSLTISYSKSTWEVGEILGIAHYKYLELKERAEKLFKLFYEYFSLHPTLIRPGSHLDPRFVDFLEGCIERRLTRKQAANTFDDSSMYVAPIRTKFLVKQITLLKASEHPHDIDLYKLILEFDRWNNWRILPRKLQQPSAYKRRNNRRDIFYIKYMCNLGEDRVQNLIDKFWYSRKNRPTQYFVVFDYDRFDDGYQIVPIKPSEDTLKELSRLFIYVFDNMDIADVYGYLVTKFQYGDKSSKKGQTFWPNYRETLLKAVNYNQVNNMDFYCERMDMAYENTDKRRLMSFQKKQSKERKGEKRAEDSTFYHK